MTPCLPGAGLALASCGTSGRPARRPCGHAPKIRGGARSSSVPAPHVTFRACAWPLRTTSRRPASSRSSACVATYCATSTARAFMSIRRAPSRASSSSVAAAACSSSAPSLSSTFSIGGVSFPRPASRSFRVVTRKDTPPASRSRSTTSGYISSLLVGLPLLIGNVHRNNSDHRREQSRQRLNHLFHVLFPFQRAPAVNGNNSSARFLESEQHFRGSYERFVKFGGPCVYFHHACLREATAAFLSERHIELLYATLTAWGMHRMGPGGAKLTEWERFSDRHRPRVLRGSGSGIKPAGYAARAPRDPRRGVLVAEHHHRPAGHAQRRVR